MRLSDHELRHVWENMRGRCRNQNDPAYKYYGARGIKVCPRWDSFANFITDVGDRPTPNHKLDRINNDGDYEPSNVRWTTQKVQMNNTRRNRKLNIRGEVRNLCEWAAISGTREVLISQRLSRGWSEEEAVFATPHSKGEWRATRAGRPPSWSKLSPDSVSELLRLLETGERTQSELAQMFGISPSRVSTIKSHAVRASDRKGKTS